MQVFANGEEAADGRESGQDESSRFVVTVKERCDWLGVERTQAGDQAVANASAKGERSQEFFRRVLDRPGGK